MVMAVGCATGSVQLFDVRNMSAFLKLHDPVAGGIQQVPHTFMLTVDESPGGIIPQNKISNFVSLRSQENM